MQISEVKSYIEQQQTLPISAADIAQQCSMSSSTLHRQFHRYYGMSMAKMQRELRLNRAAMMLAYRNEMTVLDIALTVGFDSHDGFGRAFQRYTGVTPSQFRMSPRFADNADVPYVDAATTPPQWLTELDVELEWLDTINVALLEHKGPPQRLPQSLGKFISWRKSVGMGPNRSRTFNILFDDPNTTDPEQWRFGLAAEMSKSVTLDDGMQEASVANGEYLRVRWQGIESSIGAIVAYLINDYAVDQGYTIASAPPLLERIRFYPDVPAHEAITDIRIPVLVN